jgi:hypothetical protein
MRYIVLIFLFSTYAWAGSITPVQFDGIIAQNLLKSVQATDIHLLVTQTDKGVSYSSKHVACTSRDLPYIGKMFNCIINAPSGQPQLVSSDDETKALFSAIASTGIKGSVTSPTDFLYSLKDFTCTVSSMTLPDLNTVVCSFNVEIL